MSKDLTDREIQVALLVGQGRTNREIAALLETTEKIVKNHLNNIYGKDQYVKREELVRAFGPSQQGIIEPQGPLFGL